jgi:hypothetical protein
MSGVLVVSMLPVFSVFSVLLVHFLTIRCLRLPQVIFTIFSLLSSLTPLVHYHSHIASHSVPSRPVQPSPAPSQRIAIATMLPSIPR